MHVSTAKLLFICVCGEGGGGGGELNSIICGMWFAEPGQVQEVQTFIAAVSWCILCLASTNVVWVPRVHTGYPRMCGEACCVLVQRFLLN